MLDRVDESEHRHKILFETSSHGIIYRDAEGTIISANPVAEKILGNQLLTENSVNSFEIDSEFIQEDLTPYPAEKYPGLEALSTGRAETNKIMGVLHYPAKTCTWLRIASIPIFREDETKPYLVYSMLEDITRLREQEQERLDIERQMLHAQKLESLGIMAGGIAHDFNNLLQAILGNLELVSRKADMASSTKKHISNAIISSQKAAHLTSLLLAYVGKGFIVKKELDLNQLIMENCDILKSAASKSVNFEMSLATELPAINADVAQIQQVVMNLITNASEAIVNHPGFVRITTNLQNCDQAYLASSLLKEKPEPGCFVSLEVSDNGCGMNRETINRLFDPFFTTKFTGRGLGMSAVMGIIKGHSGALFVKSVVDKGSTFKVLFPLSDTVLPARTQLQPTAQIENPITSEIKRSGLALVVDDEKPVLKICTKMVKLCGLNVITAYDGADAVTRFRERADEIDIVLMDLTMPNMDGIAAMIDILEIRPDAKVILASGFNEEEFDDRIKNHAPAGFIRKPYNLKQLEMELQKIVHIDRCPTPKV